MAKRKPGARSRLHRTAGRGKYRVIRQRRTAQRRRALSLLARSPKGCTEAAPMAHGFPIEMLEKLVTAGLTEAWSEEIISRHPGRSLWQPGRRKRLKIVWMEITEEGRKAIAGQ